MQFEFFTIPVHDFTLVQAELNTFCATHRIVSVDKYFIADSANSFWSICLSYLNLNQQAGSSRQGKIDYREILAEKDFAVFAKLRTLRKTLADEENLPAYALFTNEQLAKMVENRVTTLSALQEIHGIGKSRIEKYGARFLELLQEAFSLEKEHKTASDKP